MLERSTISRNLALMQEKAGVAAVGTSAAGRAMSVTITDADRSASEQCEWPVRPKSMPPGRRLAAGLVLLDGGRASGRGACYRLVAASDDCRTRTVICIRSLKPSFS
jgi:hypothetical protein